MTIDAVSPDYNYTNKTHGPLSTHRFDDVLVHFVGARSISVNPARTLLLPEVPVITDSPMGIPFMCQGNLIVLLWIVYL